MSIAGTQHPSTSNRLIDEKSPYLLQHAHNPVDWRPWGEQAFQKAAKEDKPVFLSIGYATCHWCHVMAHESFEDEAVARLLNEYFVAIKVDREERPDVDKIYMTVCQSLTGHGGWPLSVFMTPDGKPFFAGTYFPKSGRGNMPGFMDVLQQVAAIWEKDRSSIIQSSEAITQAIQPPQASGESVHFAAEQALEKGFSQLARAFDPNQGGFGTAPKFPTPHNLGFLLRWYRHNGDTLALEMVEKTLDAMRNGGIFDQVGFGFHRYSVDQHWLVPHFEKMLYDQALLAMAYTEAYQATKKERYARIAHEVFTYILRDMTSPQGGFYSAQDADSEGKEGRYYVWTPREVVKHLGEKSGGLFCGYFGITDTGNFEDHQSIPHIRMPLETFGARKGMDPVQLQDLLEKAREKLFQVRENRVAPLKDDKILTSWNGLMIAALAKAGQAFDNAAYTHAAKHAAGFVLDHLKARDGRLFRRFRNGHAAHAAYLDDYAFLVWGLIELYEATFEVGYLKSAVALNRHMIDIFWDHEGGGLFFTGKGNEQLITKSKDLYDGALPSGNSVAAMNFMRLSRLTGNVELETQAEKIVLTFARQVSEHPMGYTYFLQTLDFMVGPGQEVVVVGDTASKTTQDMIRSVRNRFLPNTVLLVRPLGTAGNELAALVPFVGPMVPIEGRPTAYVCEHYACKKPMRDVLQLQSALQ